MFRHLARNGYNNGSFRMFMGVVAGEITNGTISNVTVSGRFDYQCVTNGLTWIGGIAGNSNNTEISNCTNNISIDSMRYSIGVGGIVGLAVGGSVSNCTNNGNISTAGTKFGGKSMASAYVAATYSSKPILILICNNTGIITATSMKDSNAILNGLASYFGKKVGGCDCYLCKTSYACTYSSSLIELGIRAEILPSLLL